LSSLVQNGKKKKKSFFLKKKMKIRTKNENENLTVLKIVFDSSIRLRHTLGGSTNPGHNLLDLFLFAPVFKTGGFVEHIEI
jgi:hypothetical protein